MGSGLFTVLCADSNSNSSNSEKKLLLQTLKHHPENIWQKSLPQTHMIKTPPGRWVKKCQLLITQNLGENIFTSFQNKCAFFQVLSKKQVWISFPFQNTGKKISKSCTDRHVVTMLCYWAETESLVLSSHCSEIQYSWEPWSSQCLCC